MRIWGNKLSIREGINKEKQVINDAEINVSVVGLLNQLSVDEKQSLFDALTKELGRDRPENPPAKERIEPLPTRLFRANSDEEIIWQKLSELITAHNLTIKD